jgi:glutaconate CoA-transferase, subunit B
VMKFDETTREMYLAETYPGITAARVEENTGFPIDLSRAVESKPPSVEEIRILREEVDPQRLILR